MKSLTQEQKRVDDTALSNGVPTEEHRYTRQIDVNTRSAKALEVADSQSDDHGAPIESCSA